MSDEHEAVSATDQLASLESKIVDTKSDFRRLSRHRSLFYVISLGMFISLIFKYFGGYQLPLWIEAPIWIIGFLFLLAALGTEPNKILSDLEKLESLKRLYFGFLDVKDEPYFDRLVKINVENLSEYYSLVKQHSQQSFKLSGYIIFLGFVLIFVGLGLGFYFRDLKDIAYISSGAGVVVSFIGGSVFVLYSKTVLQLKQYHDSLLDVQNVLLAFKLVEATADVKEKSAMTQKMIEFLSSRRL